MTFLMPPLSSPAPTPLSWKRCMRSTKPTPIQWTPAGAPISPIWVNRASLRPSSAAARPGAATPRQMIDLLKRTYCGRIGYEFMHINDAEQKDWLQRRIEGVDKEISFTPEGKKAILNKLIEAEGFEKFAANRFVGTKRFGLDG